MESFMTEYAKQLEKAVREKPGEYAYTPDKVPEVLARMRSAFANDSYNKDGTAIRWTCKALGIPATRKAINHFIANHK